MDDHKKRDHVPLKESDTLPGSGLSERSFFGDAQMTRNELRRITLKVQKANDFSGEGSVQNQSPGKKIRVCKVCNKSFSSGRALGGHMRTHAEVQGDDVLIQNQNSKLKVYHPTPKNRLISYANSGKYKASNATGGVPIKANPINNSNPSCSLCGKDFPSMKSLFGHMRCHPEREWRGIQRPPAAKNSSSSTVSDSVGQKVECQIDSGTTTGKSAFNLAQSLPSWSVTAKRGRKSIASLGSKESIPDAVYDLMMLAQGNSLDSVLSNKRRSEQSEAPNRDFPPKQPKIEDGDQDFEYLDPSKKRTSEESQSGNREFPSKKLKRSNPEPVNMDSTWDYTNGFGEDWKQSNEEESDSQTSDYCTQQKQFSCLSEISKKNKKKKRKKKIKLRDLETVGDMGLIDYKQMPIAFSDNYRCSTCNKSFSSHQALGGHRTSHKKGKNNLPISDMDEYAFSDASADEEQYGVADNLTQVDGLPELDDAGSRVAGKHRCNICNKTFPTGQALGGHKRCHWTGPVEAPSSSVASPEEVSKIRRGMLDFDLNKLPVMEDEEGFESVCTQSMDIRQPVDYASSSYNSVA